MISESTGLVLLVGFALIGVTAVIAILARRERQREKAEDESRYADATEGMTRCHSCGHGNLVGSATCTECGQPLEA